MNRIHFTHNYLINPTNPVTVNLIGAGGTGSQVLTSLARINYALIQFGHPGLHVTVWDNDLVTPANLGRQLFASTEVGLPKATALINRTNRFFGTNWKAKVEQYAEMTLSRTNEYSQANIFITCVDTVKARLQIARELAKSKLNYVPDPIEPLYWLDYGNNQQSGQVMLATIRDHKQPTTKKYETVAQLPFVTDEYGSELEQSGRETNVPSCSLAEALEKQELFINPTLANMGSSLLWSLFRNGMTENRGFFLNLSDFRSQPVKV